MSGTGLLFAAPEGKDARYKNIRDLEINVGLKSMLEQAWADFNHLVPDRAQFPREFRDNVLSRGWELLLIRSFVKFGLTLEPPPAAGPDIKIRLNDKVCWVECVAPGPGDQEGLVTPPTKSGRIMGEIPEEPILLRYTSALREKVGKIAAYGAAGVIAPEDMAFVAVYQDGVPMAWTCDHFRPGIAKVLYGLGDDQIVVPISDGRAKTDEAYLRVEHRDVIEKKEGVTVHSRYFVDPGAEHISGVLTASNFIMNCDLLPRPPLVVLHNPLARVPAPRRMFPVKKELWIDESGPEPKLMTDDIS